VSHDADALDPFARDESGLGDYPAELLTRPRTTAEVQAVFRACSAAGVPVTPVGARTGKSGGSLLVQGGVALSLLAMNRIISVDADDLTLTCQPGVVLAEVMRAAEAVGLFYPPDPNSWESCTLGGNVAENAGGPRALKYGVTRDYVLSLEWVLPGGEALRVGHRTIKGVAGYDLVGLFVGSEGTLGVATEITVSLLPKPAHVMTALFPFRDAVTAAAATSRVLRGGVLPRAMELLDDVALSAVRGKGLVLPEAAGAVVIVEVDGASEAGVLAELNLLSELCTAAGALEALVAADASQAERIWAVRRAVSTSLKAMAAHKLSEDVVVPRSRVAEAIGRFKAAGAKEGLLIATYGHLGDGNLHTNVLWQLPSQRTAVDRCLDQIMRITLELGGTITGEHGVGLSKLKYLAWEQSPQVLELQRRLKGMIDPRVILNPGKMLPEPE
jgi:glycolate oxidase